ncbi:MAG: GAF domain-containing protein [Clostridia bacterium]|nr:GAF domain-containing protein [Clostridia bacterium]
MENYEELTAMASALADGDLWDMSVYANISALLYGNLPDVSWAGFYIAKSHADNNRCDPGQDTLLLGPFCGKPACVVIPFGKGVCGTAALKKETLVVEDVEKFPGHIACDPDSRSEIVVPLMKDGRVIGVLDIDSDKKGRFGGADKEGLEKVCRMLETKI